MAIEVTWQDNNGTETGHEVYVRATQMTWDTDLPSPTTVGADVTSAQIAVDETQPWYVIVAAVRGSEKAPSAQLYWDPAAVAFQVVPDPSTPYPAAMTANTGTLSLQDPDKVEVPDAPELNLSAPFTIEWRGSIDGGDSNQKVLLEKPYTSHAPPYYQYGLYASLSSKTVRFDLTVNGTRKTFSVSGLSEVLAGQRMVVSATYDGSVMQLYVNGRLVGSNSASGTTNGYATPLIFNKHGNISADLTDSTVDEVRIWSEVRTKEQIVLNLDRNMAGDETNLTALWNFNETSGTSVPDQTANGNDGTISGSTYSWNSLTETWDGTNNEKWHYPSRLNLVTYEGSGQTVHPSVAKLDTALGGYTWWMAATPYPDGNDNFENPSIWASNNGVDWEVPAGLTNPIDPEPAGGFNSDPCLLVVEDSGTRTLYLYWRETVDANDDWFIHLSKSTDGVNWTPQTPVLSGNSTTLLVSPMVFVDASGTFHMLTMSNSGDLNRFTSPDGESWTQLGNGTITGMPVGRFLWHLSGYQHPTTGRIHMILDTVTAAGGVDARACYAYSDDLGANVTIAGFLTEDQYSTEDTHQYHGCLVEDSTYQDRFWVFVSGRNGSSQDWNTYLIMRRLVGNDLFQENAKP